MNDAHPDVVRAVALDQLAAGAQRRGIVALYYPGRVLATIEPVHRGDYVRVPVWGLTEEPMVVDFKTDSICAQWYAPTREGNWQRGRLFVYENQPEDTKRFTAALDVMLEECGP